VRLLCIQAEDNEVVKHNCDMFLKSAPSYFHFRQNCTSFICIQLISTIIPKK